MAEYQLSIVTPEGETWDVTQRVSTLTWSGSVKQMARQISATMLTPENGELPELPCALGNELHLQVGGKCRFLGSIVTRDHVTGSATTDLAALDRGRFLAKNDGWYQFSGTAPETAVQAVCSDFGIPVGSLAAAGVAVTRKYPGVALNKIVDSLYTLAAEQNGKRYLARFNGNGQLEVVEKPATASMELAPRKNLQTLRVKEDISALQNAVAIYTESGTPVRTINDDESVKLYGQFQHIITQRSDENVEAEAKAWLEDNGLQQTMTVECLGDPELISGNAVILRTNTTGVAGLCWIDSDTHTWKNKQHFCRLTLNFRNLMNETKAGTAV